MHTMKNMDTDASRWVNLGWLVFCENQNDSPTKHGSIYQSTQSNPDLSRVLR